MPFDKHRRGPEDDNATSCEGGHELEGPKRVGEVGRDDERWWVIRMGGDRGFNGFHDCGGLTIVIGRAGGAEVMKALRSMLKSWESTSKKMTGMFECA
jgi:hypothetical protein